MSRQNSEYLESFLLHAENARLRKKIESLENLSALTTWRKSTEKELAKRDRAIAREKKRYEHLLDRWRYTIRYNNSASGRDASRKIAHLTADISSLHAENDSLRAQLQESHDIIKKLTAQLNHNFENSSIPSSDKPFHKSIKNSRQKTSRKPGAQNGHPAHPRPHMAPTEEPIFIPIPEKIKNNPDYYLTGKIITKQVLDLHVSLSVKEYRTPEYRSKSTGTRGHAPFPDKLENEFSYGPNVKALAFLLNNYCNVSIDKTSELLSGLTDGMVTLSKGMINDLTRQFSDSTVEDRKHIFSMLLMSPIMHSDATPARINGKGAQIILSANPDEVLFSFRDHKGHEGIKGTPVETYTQTLVHDHDKTYYSYGGNHQECLAHVLRYLEDSIENEPDLTWNSSMKALLSETIDKVKHSKSLLSDAEVADIETRYDEIIRDGECQYRNGPPCKYYPDGFNLMIRMRDYKHNHLLFLHHPEIPYTNNLAERELRKFKRKQKQAVTFRSRKTVEFLCNCMSIIETGRLRGYNIFITTRNCFA